MAPVQIMNLEKNEVSDLLPLAYPPVWQASSGSEDNPQIT